MFTGGAVLRISAAAGSGGRTTDQSDRCSAQMA
jgi:hypothetical protein